MPSRAEPKTIAYSTYAILASQTYARDWMEFDGKMCLSSAGAERVGRLFDIQYFETNWQKEKFTDAIGEGYRYVYECKAARQICVTLSSFKNDRGKWLERTLKKAREMHAQLNGTPNAIERVGEPKKG